MNKSDTVTALAEHVDRCHDVWSRDAEAALVLLDSDATPWEPETFELSALGLFKQQNGRLMYIGKDRPVCKAVIDVIVIYMNAATDKRWRLAP